MEDSTELQWRYMKDNLDQARHYEVIRTNITNIIVTIAGAAFAVVGFNKTIDLIEIPLLVFVFFLGLFGAIMSAKQTERALLYYNRARAYRQAIAADVPSSGFGSITKPWDAKHERRFSCLTRVTLWEMWIWLHVSICVLAAILAAIGWHGGGR